MGFAQADCEDIRRGIVEVLLKSARSRKLLIPVCAPDAKSVDFHQYRRSQLRLLKIKARRKDFSFGGLVLFSGDRAPSRQFSDNPDGAAGP